MAIKERHKYKTALGYHLRQGSELREIMNESAAGFTSGTLWGKGPALVIPAVIGGIGTIMCAGVADDLGGDLMSGIETRYEDPAITSHVLGGDGLTYSAVVQNNEAGENPYILVTEGDTYRLYETEQDGDALHWTFVDNQPQALNMIGETLNNLRRAEDELAEGNSEYIPSFGDFDGISALFSYNEEVMRTSDLPDTDMNGIPFDLSDHISEEISLWQDAFDAIESGRYGFSITSRYNVIADDEVAPATFSDAPHNAHTQLTLTPHVNAAATYDGGEMFLTSMQYLWGTIAGFSLLLGGAGAVRGGAGEYMHQRRQRKGHGRTYS